MYTKYTLRYTFDIVYLKGKKNKRNLLSVLLLSWTRSDLKPSTASKSWFLEYFIFYNSSFFFIFDDFLGLGELGERIEELG